MVRTIADAKTISHLMHIHKLPEFVQFVTKPREGYFCNHYNALDYLDAIPKRLEYALRHTKTSREASFKLKISNASTRHEILIVKGQLKPGTRYYTEHNLDAGQYVAEAEIEGWFAHQAQFSI